MKQGKKQNLEHPMREASPRSGMAPGVGISPGGGVACSTSPGGTRRGGLLLLALCLCLAVTAVFSFAFYRPEEEGGELYAAAVALKDTLQKNEAVAVFLGLSPEEPEAPEQDGDILEKAKDYIAKHNGRS